MIKGKISSLIFSYFTVEGQKTILENQVTELSVGVKTYR